MTRFETELQAKGIKEKDNPELWYQYKSDFNQWLDTNGNKPYTQQDLNQIIRTRTATSEVQSSRWWGESSRQVTNLELSRWAQDPSTMPNDVALPAWRDLTPDELRAEAGRMTSLYAKSADMAVTYEALLRGITSETERKQYALDFQRDRKYVPKDWELAEYITRKAADKRQADRATATQQQQASDVAGGTAASFAKGLYGQFGLGSILRPSETTEEERAAGARQRAQERGPITRTVMSGRY